MPQNKYLIREIETDKNAVELFQCLSEGRHGILLDSSLVDGDSGRYSIILSDPFILFASKGGKAEVTDVGAAETRRIECDPVACLKNLINEYNIGYAGELPFISGAAGYFSYELWRMLIGGKNAASGPVPCRDDLELPEIMLGFYDSSVTVDHFTGKVYIAASDCHGASGGNCCEDRVERIAQIIANGSAGGCCGHGKTASVLQSNFTYDSYRSMVSKAKEYIRDGDIYQVNLSQRFSVRLDEEPFRVYKRLRDVSPAPFAAFLDFEGIKVLSSSPERFMKINRGIAETRPIKGTRPRGTCPDEDAAYARELMASIKDRAEHIMIVDLERNDLGRFCNIGSVKVDRLLSLEKYSNVFHLVSTVTGSIKDGSDIIDCIMSAFPGGSITGAPKIRSMEIIEELEPVDRNVYTGSIGYIGFNRTCDLNIAIRTVVIKDHTAYYHVGGGIVWDSTPEEEYQESMDKGSGMMKALCCV